MQSKDRHNEWFTPLRYITAAQAVMGGIDLDPASCSLANETVQAQQYFTEETNGLLFPWYGRVWLNPPFGRVNGSGASKIKMFTLKLFEEYRAGNVTEAILLSTVQTNATWFQLLWDHLLCFTNHRVHFNKLVRGRLEVESRESHMLGTVFMYLGAHETRFIDCFRQFGPIVKAVDMPPKQEVLDTFKSLWEE